MINVWASLVRFGFKPDASVLYSDVSPGFSFILNGHRFSAVARSIPPGFFERVIQVSAIVRTERTLEEVLFELPWEIESIELLAAHLYYHFHRIRAYREFFETSDLAWIPVGRRNQHLLPWEIERVEREARWARERAIYDARIHCMVDREWFKPAIRALALHLQAVEDDEDVSLGFKNSLLTIKCAGRMIPMMASGNDWDSEYVISAGNLRALPQKFATRPTEIGVVDDQLRIGKTLYPGLRETPKE